MDSHAYMKAISPVRTYPMRMQSDLDISVGYMHSGYPFMSGLDVAGSTLNTSITRYDHWGQFHELGHNHQESIWSWKCTGEVTCNFFSVRAQYVLRNQKNPANLYGWNKADMTSRATKRAAYLAGGAVYSMLCKDPSLYLDSFLQIAEDSGYGLALLRDTIASYASLTEKPKTDDDKLQTWVKQQSKVVGSNLSPYYKKWGWPVSAATETALAYLPTWTPTFTSASVPTTTYQKTGSDHTAKATMHVLQTGPSTTHVSSAIF